MLSKRGRILSLIFAIGRRMRDDEHYSMLHFHTLRYIEREKRPSMHDVAHYLRVTPPAATLLVDGLVKDKLIKRALDTRDRRAVRLSLTSRGKLFLTRGIQKKVKKLKSVFSVLTQKEQAQLATILEKVAGKNH